MRIVQLHGGMRSDDDRHTERIFAGKIWATGYGDLAIGGCRFSEPARFHPATEQQEESLGTLKWFGGLTAPTGRKVALHARADQAIDCRRCGSEIALTLADRPAEGI